MRKKAFLTGVTGQDGSYLAELLLAKGYEVHGLVRRSSSFNTGRIDHIYEDPHVASRRLVLHHGDLSDGSAMARLLTRIGPDEVYNLGAQSHVKVSFDVPEYTGDVVGLGVTRLLEAIREAGIARNVRFYQASSSELYGKVLETPQTERTPFYPRSPYAAAKAYAFYMVRNYREAYGLYAVNGILFNHESPRRGETFVTRKVTRAVARIREGLQDCLYLGNLDARRDWGFAGDYVEAMWLMLQQPKPDDYVVATGESRSVRELCERAFARAGIEMEWRGKGESEVGVAKAWDGGAGGDAGVGAGRGMGRSAGDRRARGGARGGIAAGGRSGKGERRTLVRVDPRYFRPTEVDMLMGDASKALRKLGWKPKVGFGELVDMMVDGDLAQVRRLVNGIGKDGPVASGREER